MIRARGEVFRWRLGGDCIVNSCFSYWASSSEVGGGWMEVGERNVCVCVCVCERYEGERRKKGESKHVVCHKDSKTIGSEDKVSDIGKCRSIQNFYVCNFDLRSRSPSTQKKAFSSHFFLVHSPFFTHAQAYRSTPTDAPASLSRMCLCVFGREGGQNGSGSH